MATSINPDKFIRKAIFDKINGIIVSSKTIKCFDSRAPTKENEYVLLTAQSKDQNKTTKCGYDWDCSLLIEIYTKSTSSGNTGSRLLLNDIEQAVWNLLKPTIEVDNFKNIKQNISFENQLETITDTEIIFRSFLRLELTLT